MAQKVEAIAISDYEQRCIQIYNQLIVLLRNFDNPETAFEAVGKTFSISSDEAKRMYQDHLNTLIGESRLEISLRDSIDSIPGMRDIAEAIGNILEIKSTFGAEDYLNLYKIIGSEIDIGKLFTKLSNIIYQQVLFEIHRSQGQMLTTEVLEKAANKLGLTYQTVYELNGIKRKEVREGDNYKGMEFLNTDRNTSDYPVTES